VATHYLTKLPGEAPTDHLTRERDYWRQKWASVDAELQDAIRRLQDAALDQTSEDVEEGLRERIEKLPTFEPEHDESNPQPYALGNDPIYMAEEEYPDTMGPAQWLRRSDVLALFPQHPTDEERKGGG
jgi:hypothetical protein